MYILKEDLDTRICDIEELAGNKETYREFIRNSEEEFGLEPAPLDDLTSGALNDYLAFLDDLWNK